MAIDPTAPVSAIEGIGPVIARKFESMRVYAAFDLLRATAKQLHEAVKDVASEKEVRSWRQAATLLQVAEVTPQWAEALVAAGVITLADLGRRRLEELETIFLQAREKRIIPSVPTPGQIAEMMKDAVLLNRSAAITGTVRDETGQPIAGAIASTGAVRQTTDAHGRFRLLRLPLGGALYLRIEHERYSVFERIIDRPVTTGVIHVEIIQLSAQPSETVPTAQRLLSELAGDAMPSMLGHSISSREFRAGELHEGDVLLLMSFYENGAEAKLVSKLLCFTEGKFFARWLRQPLAQLPDNAKLGEKFQVRAGKLQRVLMNNDKLQAYTLLLQLRQRHAREPKPETEAQIRTAFDNRLAEMRELGLLK